MPLTRLRQRGQAVLLLGPLVHVRSEDDAFYLENDDILVRLSPVETLHELFTQLNHGMLEPSGWECLESLVRVGIVGRCPFGLGWTVGVQSAKEIRISSAAFVSGYLATCNAWAEQVFSSPFWQLFHSGKASEVQVFSFVAQLYYRTLGADTHNMLAAMSCSDPQISPHLMRHYREELGHAELIRDGLVASGQGGVKALSDGPHASITSFLSYMNEAASDPMQYLGCYGVFHAPWTIRTERELIEQFDHFSALYPFAEAAFCAVCSHARMDYALGHEDVAIVTLARMLGSPDAQGALSALRGAREAARRFRAVFDELFSLGTPR